ncbi:MAG: hypothetical protein GXO42_00125 [bacterium]|nr:hypothetical protein [bacterium]
MIYSADAILGVLLLGVIVAATATVLPYVKLLYAVKLVEYSKINYELAIVAYYLKNRSIVNYSTILPKIKLNTTPYVYLIGFPFLRNITYFRSKYEIDEISYKCKQEHSGCMSKEVLCKSCSVQEQLAKVESAGYDYKYEKINFGEILHFLLGTTRVKGHV